MARSGWGAAFMVFLGSWLSGFFIIVTNAWMQRPVGYQTAADGSVHLASFWELLLNPWAWWQYAHNMSGSVVTAAFVMAAVGAFYVLVKNHVEQGRIYVRLGVITGCIFTVLQLFPTGDQQGRLVARHQPATLAAMESLFETHDGAPLVILGQPNMAELKIDNPIVVPRALSFLTYLRWDAKIHGLNEFPREEWPDNVPLLYYSYHIMVGLGTLFIAVMALSAFLLWRRRLFEAGWMLWILMLSFPFPFIANTAGWMTAEIGRQPWLVYGLMRTDQGHSPLVSAGNGIFTLLGFMGMYMLLGVLFLFLIWRQIEHGPLAAKQPQAAGAVA
jgi:cytochrome d ubiquinol oxidase subunit I